MTSVTSFDKKCNACCDNVTDFDNVDKICGKYFCLHNPLFTHFVYTCRKIMCKQNV